jgi:hypothetical protein
MPYIKKERRVLWDPLLKQLALEMQNNKAVKGDLNYICFVLGRELIRQNGMNYQSISDAVDGIGGASNELGRRILDPYEDKKQNENGDIMDWDVC